MSDWQPGDTGMAGGEQVTVIQIDERDGWIEVQYPDGDLVWTPPTAVEE
jgi:uncharacterized protein YgiM (DUF1202 family)